MPRRENINNVKREKRMADFLGHSNDLITLSLSLSLSLSLIYALARPIRTLSLERTASPPYLITYASARVNIRLSMLSAMGSLIVFCLYLIPIFI